MLTFEKVLEVFQAYLDDDPLYEVVQTSHGCPWNVAICRLIEVYNSYITSYIFQEQELQ